jgi:hypothetical protein
MGDPLAPRWVSPPRQRRRTTGSIGHPVDYSLGEHVYDSFQSSFEGLLPALRSPSEALTGCFSRPRGPGHRFSNAALAAFQHPELRRGWGTWVEHFAARAANQRRLVQATRAMTSGSKGRAWRTWAASRLEHQLFLASCTRVVKRMLSSAAARAVHSWLAFAEQRRHAMRLVRKAGARFVAAALAGMFARWKCHGVESGVSLALLRRAVGALVRRGQRLAFSTWQEHGREAAERDRLLARALARMRAGGITRAWTSWAALALQRREVLDGLRRVLARWSHKQLSAGWTAWTSAAAVAQCKSNAVLRAADHLAARGQISRAAALSHWQEQVAARMAMVRKASQWMHRDRARAWRAWAAVAAERRHVQEVLRVALRELGEPREEKSMRVAWRTWAAVVQAAAAARAQAQAEAAEAGRAAELARRFAWAISSRASLFAAWRWWHHRAIALAASRMNTQAQTYMYSAALLHSMLKVSSWRCHRVLPRHLGRNDAGLCPPPPPPAPSPPPEGPLSRSGPSGSIWCYRPLYLLYRSRWSQRDQFSHFLRLQNPGCARTTRPRAARPRCASTQ